MASARSAKDEFSAEADALLALHGKAAVPHLLACITEAVGRSDDDAVFHLDRLLRSIEARAQL